MDFKDIKINPNAKSGYVMVFRGIEKSEAYFICECWHELLIKKPLLIGLDVVSEYKSFWDAKNKFLLITLPAAVAVDTKSALNANYLLLRAHEPYVYAFKAYFFEVKNRDIRVGCGATELLVQKIKEENKKLKLENIEVTQPTDISSEIIKELIKYLENFSSTENSEVTDNIDVL